MVISGLKEQEDGGLVLGGSFDDLDVACSNGVEQNEYYLPMRPIANSMASARISA
jgi:hypothetical protein